MIVLKYARDNPAYYATSIINYRARSYSNYHNVYMSKLYSRFMSATDMHYFISYIKLYRFSKVTI